jgi:FKBP-type peptidyl-prolyl cis-trans isomerase
VGGSRLLGIPSALGYGSSSPGAGIAPDEALWFVIRVNSTK